MDGVFWMAFIVCCLGIPPHAFGANIVIIPYPAFSHVAESNAVAVELARRGHRVSFYLPDDFDSSKCAPGMPTVRFGFNALKESRNHFAQISKLASDGKIKQFNLLQGTRSAHCNQLLNDTTALQKLRQMNIDFFLIGYIFFVECFFLIPFNLTVPYASITSLMSELHAGHPTATSITPFYLTSYGPNMAFSERFVNTLVTALSAITLDLLIESYDYSKIAPGLSRQEIQKLPQKSELFIENRDVILNCPKPLMPNVVQVGGLTIKPAKSLPKDIQQFFDQATHGVIIVSFGSIFQPSNRVKEILMSVFKKLKQRIFWKIKDEEKQIENVLISKWLPQNDALAHNNTKLLIYHCGNNGMFESLYHGIPLICIPHASDQFVNSRKLEYLKIGRYFDIADLTEELVLEAIEDILNNPIYTSNIKHLSEIYRSRPELPAERAASAIEHVMKYGGKHLRLNQVDLSPFQLLAVDVWFTIFMLLFLFIKLLLYFFTLCKTLVRSKSKIKQN